MVAIDDDVKEVLCRADALWKSGESEEALPLYLHAATIFLQREAWLKAIAVCQNAIAIAAQRGEPAPSAALQIIRDAAAGAGLDDAVLG